MKLPGGQRDKGGEVRRMREVVMKMSKTKRTEKEC